MFKFNNTHIFTGYLKQLLASANIPTCKIYTSEFAEYLRQHGKEDPRVIESFDTLSENRKALRVNYLKANEVYNYYHKLRNSEVGVVKDSYGWKRSSSIFYESEKSIPGLTKNLLSPGGLYDNNTHEYLGEYLRFLRDYHNVNLMSLYNCFTDKICDNLYYTGKVATFDSRDPQYKIYAIPVKLFANYTIAVESAHGIEMFCGFYNKTFEDSAKTDDLFKKTYKKINNTIFNQPFLYDCLDVKFWSGVESSITAANYRYKYIMSNDIITRWDLAGREHDLKLFIKVPISCKSSIVILEGDFRNFNDALYSAHDSDNGKVWAYQQNHGVVDFSDTKNINADSFVPISKLQLLAFNTGESHPFADRLVEYLSGSAITPIDEIPDNIKRAQRVMRQNQHYFQIEGLWENKMQKIIYDYIMNSGPIVPNADEKLEDKRQGYHRTLGHSSKSTLFDVLGYVDKDAEKWYSSWKRGAGRINGEAKVRDNIQNIDIYDGLYDI